MTRTAFYDKIVAFDDAARGAHVALFFYAGHGLQVNGRNYLAPVDLKLETRQDLRRHAIELDAVLEVMRSDTNLVILDACRNNPLAGELARALGLSRAAVASRGLARVESASGTLIAYATEPGSVAADGTGKHSPYTAALLEHLETPGLSVQDLFTQVTASVLASTDDKQKPWTHSSLSKIVRLVPEGDSDATAAAPDPATERASERLTAEQLASERVFWESVKDSAHPADIQAYLDRYPGGTYEVLARNRLETLQRSEAPKASAQTAEARLKLTRAENRLIQLGLLAAGHDLGKADGLIGSKTRTALRQWQAARGETATGYLDVESAKLLLASGREREAEHQEVARRTEQRRRQQEMELEEQEEARRQRDMAREKAYREAQQTWARLGLVMVRVEGGNFIMGCQGERDGKCYEDEKPAHLVQMRSFEIGKYEVTQALWEAVTGENPTVYRKACAECPVGNVSWEDAQGFLAELNARTEGGFRLPTEAEWEYAARGGRQSRSYRYAGGNDAELVGWYDGNSGYKVRPVGRKRANELGLYDMSGNVREWTQDCWNDNFRRSPGDGRAWERGDCSQRVMRGGSWINAPRLLRAAYRSGRRSNSAESYVGFRIARSLTP